MRQLWGTVGDNKELLGLKARVCKVHKPLMALCESVDKGSEAVFTKDHAIIRNVVTKKEVVRMPRVGRFWKLELDVVPYNMSSSPGKPGGAHSTPTFEGPARKP